MRKNEECGQRRKVWCAVSRNSEKDSEGGQKGELCISLIKKALLCFSCFSFFSPSFGSCFAFWEGPWPYFVSVNVFCQLMVNVSCTHWLSSLQCISKGCMDIMWSRTFSRLSASSSLTQGTGLLFNCCLSLVWKVIANLYLLFFFNWKGGR